MPKPLRQQPAPPSPLVDAAWVREAYFGGRVSRFTIYRRARLNLIPSVRCGRRVLFDPDQLRAWALSGGTDRTP